MPLRQTEVQNVGKNEEAVASGQAVPKETSMNIERTRPTVRHA